MTNWQRGHWRKGKTEQAEQHPDRTLRGGKGVHIPPIQQHGKGKFACCGPAKSERELVWPPHADGEKG